MFGSEGGGWWWGTFLKCSLNRKLRLSAVSRRRQTFKSSTCYLLLNGHICPDGFSGRAQTQEFSDRGGRVMNCATKAWGGGQQAVVAVLARLTIIIMFQPGSSHPQPVVSRFMDHGSYQDLLSLTLKPSSGGLEQLVTNFSSLRFSSSEKPSTTSQKVWMTG